MDKNETGTAEQSRGYRHMSEQLAKTHQNVLAAHEDITQKAIDLMKIDLLALSLVATGLSAYAVRLSLLLVGVIVSFLYSMWACIFVFDPTRYPRGISYKGGIEADERLKNGTDEQTHYRNILYSYIDATEGLDEKFYTEKAYFSNAVWSTFVGILFLFVSVVDALYVSLPTFIEIPVVLAVPLVGFWGRDKSTDTESEL
jgi:hypothetical protein